MNYTVKADGTVDASYIFAVQQAEMPKNTSVNVDDIINTAAAEAENNGFNTAAYDSDGYVGFKASKSMKKLDLKSADMEILGFKELPSIFDGFHWFYTPGVFRNTYRMTLNTNLRNIIDINMLEDLPLSVKTAAIKAIENSKVDINITLPGEEVLTNADEIKLLPGHKSTRYTWRLKVGDMRSLRISAVLEKNETKSLFVYIGVGTGFLIVFAAVIWLHLKSKKRDAV